MDTTATDHHFRNLAGSSVAVPLMALKVPDLQPETQCQFVWQTGFNYGSLSLRNLRTNDPFLAVVIMSLLSRCNQDISTRQWSTSFNIATPLETLETMNAMSQYLQY